MLIHDVEQRTPEWFNIRLGIPTASRFKDIYTSMGKGAAGANNYINTLLAEWLANKPLETYENDWMRRGTLLEDEAISYYEFVKDVEVEKVGFVTNDEETIGCSPDGLIRCDPECFDENGIPIYCGGLEVKCPAPHTHIKYLLANKCPAEYYPQVQGSILICELSAWDFMSYHPDLPALIIRVERDDEYISGLSNHLASFIEKMNHKRSLLKEKMRLHAIG